MGGRITFSTTFAIFLVASLLLHPPVFAATAAPAQSPDAEKNWCECVQKLSPHCALDFIDDLSNEGSTLSNNCCSQLVSMGKHCYDTLFVYMADRPWFRARKNEYEKRSKALWDKCVAITKA